MSLINPAILWGLSLVSVPLILHFLLRSRPKKYLFPALRIVRARRLNNIRRFRLKHVWLLLLRMAVLALLVAAIARPTLPAANYHPSLSESLTAGGIAAVGIAGYSWSVRRWKRRRLPNHVFHYRRTLLRGVTGFLAFAVFVLAVGIPYERRIAGEIAAPLPSAAENLPVAAVLLFDSSLSMSYRQRNLTRLEVAQKIAGEQLSRLPRGSRVAVSDTSSDSPLVFQAEQSGALDRIQKLQPRDVSFPPADRIRAALDLHQQDYRRTVIDQESVPAERRKDRFLREIYFFTDLTAIGWRAGDFKSLRAELQQDTSVQLYLIDVGVEKVTNAAINVPRLSSASIAKGTDLTVEAAVDVVGFEGDSERTLELHVQNEAGELVKRERRTLRPSSGKPAATSFIVGGLTRPLTQGELRLVSSDPYSVDDVRYFTVAVTPLKEILIAGETRSECRILQAALAPKELEKAGKARYNVKFKLASELGATDFKGLDVVCLVNVAAPSQTSWSALADFVERGGGLLVVAGNERLSIASYDSVAAQSVLPGRLRANVKLPTPALLDLRTFDHPIFKKFESFDGGFGDLATAKVYRRWGVTPNKGAAVVATYTDPAASPAILDRVLGAGCAVLITTGLDLGGWSDLARARWQYFVFVDQLARYLARQSNATYNYIVGDDVTIPLPPSIPIHNYLLRKPGMVQLPGEVLPGAKAIRLKRIDQVGPYEIVSRDDNVSFTSAFSANAPAAESDFTRVTTDELDQDLGKGRYSVAQSIEGLTRNVAFGRVGQEVFSLILGVVIAVFCVEHFVANRFYEAEQSVEHQ